MCLIRCNVRNTGTPSGTGVSTRPRDNQPNSQDEPRRINRNRKHRTVDGDTAGPEQGGTILATGMRNKTSMQAPRGDSTDTDTDNHPPGTSPTHRARVRSHRLHDTVDNPPERTRDSPTDPPSGRDRRQHRTRFGQYDTGCERS